MSFYDYVFKLVSITYEKLVPIDQASKELSHPILIYQMGKVASSSIYSSLKSQSNLSKSVFHVHRMDQDNIDNINSARKSRFQMPLYSDIYGVYLLRRIRAASQRIKVISLVRDPVSRNVSAYFQNLGTFNKRNVDSFQPEQLLESFLNEYPHETPLDWFDVELIKTTDIDIYSYEFNRESGFSIISKGNVDLLLMHHDLDDDQKTELLSDFLEVPCFKIVRVNEGQNKVYNQKYNEFLKSVNLPQVYLDRMLSSKYAKHFYSVGECDRIRKKWMHEL